MVARKPRAAQTTVNAREFDLAGFLSGFKPAVVAAKLHRRGDLIPVMADLDKQIEKAESRQDKRAEKSITDEDPVANLIAEWNRVVAEFDAGGYEEFQFRPMTAKIHTDTWNAYEASEKVGDQQWLIFMRMAETCVSHPDLTGEDFAALRDHVGEFAFDGLAKAFNDAYSGGAEPDAGFLPRFSPTPGGEESSSVSEQPVSGDNLPSSPSENGSD